MTYAIIETSGTQLRVEPGRFYDVNRLAAGADESITIENVLLIQNDGDVTIGQPLIAGATVEATVLQHLRGRKIIVYKMRPKKKSRKKQGHRQELTRVMINSINLNGAALGSSQQAAGAKSATASDAADTEESAETAAE
jgi:large subunit ribosomal protein L21